MEHLSILTVKTRLREIREMHYALSRTQDRNGQWDWFLEKEMVELMTFIANEKVRLAGRTGLRTRLMSLLTSIVNLDRKKRKEGAA